MSKSDDSSYFSRFMARFVEIIAAGFATAVSGYLIAHLGATLSSPAPASTGAIEITPSVGMTSGSPPAKPTPPASADANEPLLGTRHDANALPVAQPARRAVNATKAAALRKHMKTETSATENRRDQESVAAQVRAALANIDANRPEQPDATHQDNLSRPAAIIGAQPWSVDDPLRVPAVTAAPAGVVNIQPAPVPQLPIESNPVEVRRPAAVEAFPAPPAPEETGVFSAFDQILRHDPLASADEAPRPPMPVGQQPSAN
jgi:hypothetical protein